MRVVRTVGEARLRGGWAVGGDDGQPVRKGGRCVGLSAGSEGESLTMGLLAEPRREVHLRGVTVGGFGAGWRREGCAGRLAGSKASE